MKAVSFAVPCYNSEAYMKKCLDSLLELKSDCEIIIVNDGSKDGTAAIADEYAAAYPDVISVVHKENGGHGSGVNVGLAKATGLYYKVVDSDDWVDVDAARTLFAQIKKHIADGVSPDMYVTNYVYEHVSDNTRFVRRYTNQLPTDKLFGWDEVGKFIRSNFLMMHAVWYKTETARKSGVVLPEKTYYVDDIFCYTPMPSMHTMYYMDLDVYRYFIGRADQSVNLKNCGKNYKMQIRVMTEIINAHDVHALKAQEKQLFRYMRHLLHIFMITTCTFCAAEGSKEAKKDMRDFWAYVKKTDKWAYNNLRKHSYSLITYLPWPIAKRLMLYGYGVLQKKVKLG